MVSYNSQSWANSALNFHRDRTPIRRSARKTTFGQSQWGLTPQMMNDSKMERKELSKNILKRTL